MRVYFSVKDGGVEADGKIVLLEKFDGFVECFAIR